MKRTVLSVVILIMLLCGCQISEPAEGRFDKLSKAQKITVLSADTGEVIKTITNQTEIDAFVMELAPEKWTLAELPQGVEEVGVFRMSQVGTVKLEQTQTDTPEYDIGTLTLYEDGYLVFEVAGWSMTFEIGQESAAYLDGYFD